MRRTVELDVVLLTAPSLGVIPARRRKARLRRIAFLLLGPAAIVLAVALLFVLASQA